MLILEKMNIENIINSEYIYYLNIKELRYICSKFNINYIIYLELNNKLIKSGYFDDKKTMINNIQKFFNNKSPKITIYKESIICFKDLDKISSNDYIYFGQFKNGNKKILNLIKRLTKIIFTKSLQK